MKNTSYSVTVYLNDNGIEDAKCTCARGIKCHHIAALCLYGHYNISVTDVSCSWNAPKSTSVESINKLHDLYPLNYDMKLIDVPEEEGTSFNQKYLLNHSTVRDNVEDGCLEEDVCSDPGLVTQCPSSASCIGDWRSVKCECLPDHVGLLCQPVCEISPCAFEAKCIEDDLSHKGYRCDCNSTSYSGEYCELKVEQSCPGSWWGRPVCRPCQCDEDAGYHSDCNKTPGQCYCKKNHYQPEENGACLPCNCYSTGLFGPNCDQQTDQCRCCFGVIGRHCQDCPNSYAEVTL